MDQNPPSDVPQEAQEIPQQPPMVYEPPKVVTYRGEEILEKLGPVQACLTYVGAVICP